jgi:adenosylcobyric acid synthase
VAEFPLRPDLIILPGTKNTLSDLAWLWREELAQHIRQLAKRGCAVLGICGGYQLLGERLSDFLGVEAAAGTVASGLNLLPVETFFEALTEKTTLRCQAQITLSAARGLFAHLGVQNFQAYQIHIGRTVASGSADQGDGSAFQIATGGEDGTLNADGWCAGYYLHGLFENEAFRRGIIAALAERRSLELVSSDRSGFDRQGEYEKLATMLRAHLDIPRLRELCNLM